MPEQNQAVGFRLPPALVAQLDTHAERLSRENGGARFTRTQALVMLVTLGLDRVDARAKRLTKTVLVLGPSSEIKNEDKISLIGSRAKRLGKAAR